MGLAFSRISALKAIPQMEDSRLLGECVGISISDRYRSLVLIIKARLPFFARKTVAYVILPGRSAGAKLTDRNLRASSIAACASRSNRRGSSAWR